MEKIKTSNLKALIIDDEKSICDSLTGVLNDEGWDCFSANSGRDGIRIFQDHDIDLIFLDVWMPGLDGIETLQLLKEIKNQIPIVIMSGHATIETAVKATKLGAFDFLEKPLSLDKILPMIAHAKKSKSIEESHFLPSINNSKNNYEIIGISDSIASLHRQIKMIASRNSWVLITGENGTGKEVVARNIHLLSRRADKPFVAVNCAAIPEELIESELFGYMKGAFTNATSSKKGKFEIAHQGTLFLDEIGDMSLKTQAKILRILQEQNFQRLGDNATVSIDVRVIAATNKDLQEEMKLGNFRQDLYYRLNVIPVQMSPLRERKGDIPVLCDFYLNKIAHEFGDTKKTINPAAMQLLEQYQWPGNVRELKNMMERLCIMVSQGQIDEVTMAECLAYPHLTRSEIALGHVQLGSETLREAKNNFERTFLLEKLEENEWNISKTAEIIGIERSNLHRKMKTYDLEFKRKKS